jgi:hypothetical protein
MQLAHDVANGVDVPFEVVDASEVGNSFQPLWCYRTLTAEFIGQRIGPIGNLPEYRAAAHELERVDGLDEWLLARGEQHVPATAPGRAKAVLNVFLAEVLGDEPTFEFDAQRFETSWALLDAMLFRGRTAVMLAAPIHGVDLESDDVRLADGTLLVTNRSAEAEGLPADIFRGDGLPVVVALVDVSDTNAESLSAARQQLRKLLSALRLFGDANPALAGAARMQVARGPWQVLSLEGSGSASGLLDIETGSEAEFVEFYELVASRWPRNGEIAWALRRHEFGCDPGLGKSTEGPLGQLAPMGSLMASLSSLGPGTSLRVAGWLCCGCRSPLGFFVVFCLPRFALLLFFVRVCACE